MNSFLQILFLFAVIHKSYQACSNHTYYGGTTPDCATTSDCCQYAALKLNFVCLFGRCVCLLPGEKSEGRKEMICCTTGQIPDSPETPCPTAKSGEICYTRNENPNANCDSGLSCAGDNLDIKLAMGSPFPEDYKVCQTGSKTAKNARRRL